MNYFRSTAVRYYFLVSSLFVCSFCQHSYYIRFPKPMIQYSLLIRLIIATLFFITSHRSPRVYHSVPLLKSLFTPCSISHHFQTVYHCLLKLKLMQAIVLFQLLSLLFGTHPLNMLSHQIE